MYASELNFPLIILYDSNPLGKAIIQTIILPPPLSANLFVFGNIRSPIIWAVQTEPFFVTENGFFPWMIFSYPGTNNRNPVLLMLLTYTDGQKYSLSDIFQNIS